MLLEWKPRIPREFDGCNSRKSFISHTYARDRSKSFISTHIANEGGVGGFDVVCGSHHDLVSHLSVEGCGNVGRGSSQNYSA